MPAPLPQPVLAPLTPAAIFLVATIDDGGEADRPRRAGRHRRAGARGRVPRPGQAAVGGDVDRLGRLGPVVLRSSARRAASVHRARRRAPPRAGDTGRSAVPHPRRVDGRVLRTGGQLVAAMEARSPSSTRCTASGSSTTATCSASSTAPRTPTVRWRDSATRSATRTPTSPAAATCMCRSTCTTWTSWNALSVDEQERVIGRTKLDDIELDDEVKPAELAHRAQRHRRRGRQRAEDRAAQHAVR